VSRLLVLFLLGLTAASAQRPDFRLPSFPSPQLAADEFGQNRRIGLLSFIRQLYSGGVSSTTVDDINMLDSDYAVIQSTSLPLLAAWLEATCQAVDFDLIGARKSVYDGTVTARLLEIGATLATLRQGDGGLAMPIGFIICNRRKPWGDLPGDGARDAYALIETERGLEVYDPPTHQLVGLAQFPNTPDILNIEF